MSEGTKTYTTIPGLDAGGDLSSHQYKFVKLASTANQVIVAAAATDAIVGVLMNDPSAQGDPAEVASHGIVKVVAEASVSAGSHITSNSTGQAQGTTTANDTVMGMNTNASTSAGDLITLILTGPTNY